MVYSKPSIVNHCGTPGEANSNCIIIFEYKKKQMEIYKIKIKMKHISLFEYYSDMPRSFSAQEIKNMTEDQFLMNLRKFADKENYPISFDEEQVFTLLQIWMNSHQDAKDDPDFMKKLSDVIGDENLLYNKAVQLDKYHNSLKRPELIKKIEEVKKNIKDYEELLRMSKETLARLEFELVGM